MKTLFGSFDAIFQIPVFALPNHLSIPRDVYPEILGVRARAAALMKKSAVMSFTSISKFLILLGATKQYNLQHAESPD